MRVTYPANEDAIVHVHIVLEGGTFPGGQIGEEVEHLHSFFLHHWLALCLVYSFATIRRRLRSRAAAGARSAPP